MLSYAVLVRVVYWWCTGGVLMAHWWCTGGALVVHWWCTGGVRVVCCWHAGGVSLGSRLGLEFGWIDERPSTILRLHDRIGSSRMPHLNGLDLLGFAHFVRYHPHESQERTPHGDPPFGVRPKVPSLGPWFERIHGVAAGRTWCCARAGEECDGPRAQDWYCGTCTAPW